MIKKVTKKVFRGHDWILFIQDLSGVSQYEAGLALSGLSCFVTPDIARDLANDVLTLVSLAK